ALPKNGAMQVPAIEAMKVAPSSVARPMPRSSVIGLMKTAKAKLETTPVFIISAITAPNTIHQRFLKIPVCSMAFFPVELSCRRSLARDFAASMNASRRRGKRSAMIGRAVQALPRGAMSDDLPELPPEAFLKEDTSPDP